MDRQNALIVAREIERYLFDEMGLPNEGRTIEHVASLIQRGVEPAVPAPEAGEIEEWANTLAKEVHRLYDEEDILENALGDIKALKSAALGGVQLKAENQSLKQRVGELEAKEIENLRLIADRRHYKDLVLESEAAVSSLKQENEDLGEQLESLVGIQRELDAKAAGLEQKNEGLRKRIKELEDKLNETN